ncbi:hypothetical protein EEB12_15475 [Rhodococcus sp. WS1]|uniref:hypothetical protein n=1 Tax=unclassified Rhodococcus (in: high G+C Gram-positive bacteria) TaxID=192944 RepID=UPI001141186F|nr:MULTISPECIES: hypothetical protein [unclassified Rhodococcus (in: high G+C Gram-positive bacteria)]ROZ55221.1 hypothetical protein EEB12_15475 [Rhodococcus sp. WS1]TQC37793.1 hypothetical protein EEB16_11950 [Rhodococcus sp. WS7]
MSETAARPWFAFGEPEFLPFDWVPSITAIENIEIRFPGLDVVAQFDPFHMYYGKGDLTRGNWDYVWIRWMERCAERSGMISQTSEWEDPILPDDWRPSYGEWMSLASAFKELDLEQVHEDFQRTFYRVGLSELSSALGSSEVFHSWFAAWCSYLVLTYRKSIDSTYWLDIFTPELHTAHDPDATSDS